MKKVLKRFVAIFISMAILITGNLPIFVTANSDTEIKIGDYVVLGKYYDEPILWRCVAIDENGPLMLSDKILCFKAYDAKGNSDYHYVNGSFSNIRMQYGSNCWEDANIRQWLNSNEEIINWSHDAPTTQNVYNGYNAYDNEAGFLSNENFSEDELNYIKSFSRKVYVNNAEVIRSKYDSGTTQISRQVAITNLNMNYNNFYQRTLTDKIFILGPQEVYSVYKNFGTSYVASKPTAQAVTNSTFKDISINENSNYYYWLNYIGGGGYSYEHVDGITPSGTIGIVASAAWNGNNGIRPAFYLNTQNISYTGYGSEQSPFIINKSSNNDTDNIPSDAKELNGHYYKFYNLSMPWNKAKEYCENLGGYLATITSQEEQIFIEELISTGTKNTYWLGGTDEETEGIWKLVTGEDFIYTNWNTGEPNNGLSNGYDHYLQMYKDNTISVGIKGKWNDQKLDAHVETSNFFRSELNGFICEWGDIKNSNIFINPDDMWAFFHTGLSYDFSTEFIDYLCLGLKSSESKKLRKIIQKEQSGEWAGSCHGMAVAALLFKVKRLTSQKWTNDIKCDTLNKVTLNNNILNLINYYYFYQDLPIYKNYQNKFIKNFNMPIELKKLINSAQNVINGENPILFSFNYSIESKDETKNKTIKSERGHTLIAYNVEFAPKDNPWIKRGIEYTTRIITYDVNYSDAVNIGIKDSREAIENSYIYINKDNTKWTIPNYIDYPNVVDKKITAITSDISLLDYRSLDNINVQNINANFVNSEEYIAELTSLLPEEIIIENLNKKTFSTVNGLSYAGDLELWTYCKSRNDEHNINNEPSPLNIVLPYSTDTYRISPIENNRELELDMQYEDSFMTVKTSNATSATFNPLGIINIEGDKIDFNLSITLDNYFFPWSTIEASGKDSNYVQIKKSENGILLYSDNLKNTIVTVSNDYENISIEFNSNYNSVLITHQDNKLIICEDRNEDEIYETIINQQDEENNIIKADVNGKSVIAIIRKDSDNNNSNIITITNPITTDAITTVKITQDNFKLIEDNKNKLEIISGDISIKFNSPALKNIKNRTKDDITIKISLVNKINLTEAQRKTSGNLPVYEISICDVNKNISSLNDNISIIIPYEKKPENINYPVVYELDKNGKLTVVKDYKYNENEKKIIINTKNMSLYMIK